MDENKEVSTASDILENAISLEEKINNMTTKIDFLVDFCKMQTSINNILRFLIRKKYTEKELDEALKEFEEHEKHLREDKKEEKTE